MRDAQKKLAETTRRKRRAFLVAFLWTASVTAAVSSADAADPARPPLPLKSSATDTSTSIHANPFCGPTEAVDKSKVATSSVHLTSGQGGKSNANVRLLPIGTAIGLQPIGSNQPRRVDGPAMTVETPTGAVHNNPMIGSAHHQNLDLVDATVESGPAPVQTSPAQTLPAQTSIKLMPMNASAPMVVEPISVEQNTVDKTTTHQAARSEVSGPVAPVMPVFEPNTQPIVAEPVAVTPHRHLIPVPSLPPVEVVPPTPVAQPSIAEATPQATAVVLPEPVAMLPVVASEEVESTEVKVDAEPVTFSMTDGFGSDDEEIVEQHPMDVATDSEVLLDSKLGVVAPIIIDDSSEGSLTAIEFSLEDEEQIVELERSAPVVAVQAPVAEPTLYDRRYRAPVAVTSVPVSFGRAEVAKTDSVRSTIEPIATFTTEPVASQGPSPEQIAELTAAKAASVPLYLSRAQVRSLTIGGDIRHVDVANKNVCQAFASGPNQLKLIGTGNGVTQLVIWATPDAAAKKAGGNGAPRMRMFDIHVQEVNANGGDEPDRTALLNQSIRRAFPEVDVVVHARGGELIVAGACQSDDTAKKIVRMVRKTCLVPVRDEIVVR
ncbi:hypothetical protein Poly51_42200 [Rubripirellula tenax]|uniref:Pilus formation protein N-terminal domain-containing protein n=1 Tax=Rubripirellula tenax TaxID=2528015 RepID=A0A5C6ES49_9BACT|nr:pilus assembly protein N-terminal domain-containing protein [Rubripirellula tenax]TWU50927.1 hypothetical protein Poly51_42200 [Rubripirellula tenax]